MRRGDSLSPGPQGHAAHRRTAIQSRRRGVAGAGDPEDVVPRRPRSTAPAARSRTRRRRGRLARRPGSTWGRTCRPATQCRPGRPAPAGRRRAVERPAIRDRSTGDDRRRDLAALAGWLVESAGTAGAPSGGVSRPPRTGAGSRPATPEIRARRSRFVARSRRRHGSWRSSASSGSVAGTGSRRVHERETVGPFTWSTTASQRVPDTQATRGRRRSNHGMLMSGRRSARSPAVPSIPRLLPGQEARPAGRASPRASGRRPRARAPRGRPRREPRPGSSGWPDPGRRWSLRVVPSVHGGTRAYNSPR